MTQSGNAPLAASPGAGPLLQACRAARIPCQVVDYVQPSWRRPGLTWSGYCRWRRLLDDENIDLVHANDPMAARSIALAARRARLPMICHFRFTYSEGFVNWAFRGLPKPRNIIFNSHALHSELGHLLQKTCPNTRQTVLHNAVVLDDFFSKERFQTRPGIQRVGIVANLIPIKGHLDFLEMARLLCNRNSCEFWIIGEDIHSSGYGDQLQKHAQQLGIDRYVKFLGHRDNVAELIRQLDVVVCSSHVEPFGRCLIEAMAGGKPVVATRVGGIVEVVEDGVTGFLVSPHSPGKLADAVARLLDDASLRRSMGEAGRERAERHFGHERHVRVLQDIYQEELAA